MYTYGYCINEGKRGSRASYGVHVRGHEPITDTKGNLSKLTLLQVKQSREVASLLAVEKAIEAMCLVTPPRLALQRTLRDAYRATGTSVVLHVDLDSTMSACTTGGEQLERKGFPDRTNIGYIKRVFLAIRPLLDSKRLTICKANPTSSAHDREGAGCARQLAKDAVYKAVHDTEKASFVVNSGCTFDDSTRVQLHVPPSEYSYARSKGAWWDMEHQTFFLHREGDEPAKTDVGGYYDMRATDYTKPVPHVRRTETRSLERFDHGTGVFIVIRVLVRVATCDPGESALCHVLRKVWCSGKLCGMSEIASANAPRPITVRVAAGVRVCRWQMRVVERVRCGLDAYRSTRNAKRWAGRMRVSPGAQCRRMRNRQQGLVMLLETDAQVDAHRVHRNVHGRLKLRVVFVGLLQPAYPLYSRLRLFTDTRLQRHVSVVHSSRVPVDNPL